MLSLEGGRRHSPPPVANDSPDGGVRRGDDRGHKPRMARLVEALKGWIWRELDGSLQRAEKKKLIGVIKKADQGLRLSDHKQDASIPAVAYWNDLIGQSEFQLSITGSQNLSYCTLVFGYEWFLVGCFRASVALRSTSRMRNGSGQVRPPLGWRSEGRILGR